MFQFNVHSLYSSCSKHITNNIKKMKSQPLFKNRNCKLFFNGFESHIGVVFKNISFQKLCEFYYAILLL